MQQTSTIPTVKSGFKNVNNKSSFKNIKNKLEEDVIDEDDMDDEEDENDENDTTENKTMNENFENYKTIEGFQGSSIIEAQYLRNLLLALVISFLTIAVVSFCKYKVLSWLPKLKKFDILVCWGSAFLVVYLCLEASTYF